MLCSWRLQIALAEYGYICEGKLTPVANAELNTWWLKHGCPCATAALYAFIHTLFHHIFYDESLSFAIKENAIISRLPHPVASLT